MSEFERNNILSFLSVVKGRADKILEYCESEKASIDTAKEMLSILHGEINALYLWVSKAAE